MATTVIFALPPNQIRVGYDDGGGGGGDDDGRIRKMKKGGQFSGRFVLQVSLSFFAPILYICFMTSDSDPIRLLVPPVFFFCLVWKICSGRLPSPRFFTCYNTYRLLSVLRVSFPTESWESNG
jgi:hypothetical protein